MIKIQVRDSDIELIKIFSKKTKKQLLLHMLDVAQDIVSKYGNRISDYRGFDKMSVDGEYQRYFGMVRTIKSPSGGRGLPLRYSMFRMESGDIHVQVKTVRSTYPNNYYDEVDIVNQAFTEEIEAALS